MYPQLWACTCASRHASTRVDYVHIPLSRGMCCLTVQSIFGAVELAEQGAVGDQ
jgi:hypothetical protein